jgi:hypothetical protein
MLVLLAYQTYSFHSVLVVYVETGISVVYLLYLFDCLLYRYLLDTMNLGKSAMMSELKRVCIKVYLFVLK